MHLIKATLAIAAICLSLTAVDAAERGNGSTTRLKKSVHRASNDESGIGKPSSSRSKRSSSAHSRKNDRSSKESRRSRERHRTASNREAPPPVNDAIQPDANVQVELPRHENDEAGDTEADDVDQSSILLGAGTDTHDEGGSP